LGALDTQAQFATAELGFLDILRQRDLETVNPSTQIADLQAVYRQPLPLRCPADQTLVKADIGLQCSDTLVARLDVLLQLLVGSVADVIRTLQQRVALPGALQLLIQGRDLLLQLGDARSAQAVGPQPACTQCVGHQQRRHRQQTDEYTTTRTGGAAGHDFEGRGSRHSNTPRTRWGIRPSADRGVKRESRAALALSTTRSGVSDAATFT